MRSHRHGSIYQRNSDGLWVCAVSLPGGRRKTVASKDRAVVEAKLQELLPDPTPPKTRAQVMAEARRLGTHTEAEFKAKTRDVKTCRYCGDDLNYWNAVKDHMQSVYCGGSDSIDNVQKICWECNAEKFKTPHDQFTYTLETIIQGGRSVSGP